MVAHIRKYPKLIVDLLFPSASEAMIADNVKRFMESDYDLADKVSVVDNLVHAVMHGESCECLDSATYKAMPGISGGCLSANVNWYNEHQEDSKEAILLWVMIGCYYLEWDSWLDIACKHLSVCILRSRNHELKELIHSMSREWIRFHSWEGIAITMVFHTIAGIVLNRTDAIDDILRQKQNDTPCTTRQCMFDIDLDSCTNSIISLCGSLDIDGRISELVESAHGRVRDTFVRAGCAAKE